MAQYRKKPVVIDAEQFFYDGPRVRGVFYPDLSPDGRTWEGDAFVITIHDQRVYLQSGDWIIAEPDGEHYYPVKPDIFAATYEPLEGDMFARGEMASSPATPEAQVSKLSLSESEQLELMVIISRLQSEHSDLIERERVLDAEAADLRRQLAEARAERDEFRRRLQNEIDAHKRTLSLQDDEVAEFNAGYEACKNGEPIEAEPSDLPFDVWQHGWKVADHERLSAEVARLGTLLMETERVLADCVPKSMYNRAVEDLAQAWEEIEKRDKWALDVLKTPILTGIDVPELLRDLDMHKAEMQRLLVDNAKLRFYVVELEAASRTIDMQLVQQAAQEKYEAAFGDQAAEGRPIGVDRPGQPICQLPEGHEGPHDR